MPENKNVRFRSSSIKVPPFFPLNHHELNPQFILQTPPFTSFLSKTKHSIDQFISSIKTHHELNPNPVAQFINSLKTHTTLLISPKPHKFINPFHSNSPLLCSASLALTRGDEEGELTQPKGGGQSGSRHDEERVLISEVLVRNKDGEELERKDLENEAVAALKLCRPNSALTLGEVQEDVHRIIASGYFSSCFPVAFDTRDGIQLVFQSQTKNSKGWYARELTYFRRSL